MDNSIYQENIRYFLQEYYSLVYNPRKNRTILRFPAHRDLHIEIKDRVYKTGNRPEINAYSFYDTNDDRIFITDDLMDLMSRVSLRNSFSDDRQDWMFNVEYLLCAFHELGHLLVGHCQLCDQMRLSAVETEDEQSGLDVSLYQTLEMDADLFAGRRVAERAASMIYDGSMKHFSYSDPELFYYDTLRGIRAFFYVLEYLEQKEAIRQHDISVMTGQPQRGCQPNENTHLHPPSLARGYSTGLVFMEHMRKYFKIPGSKDEFMKIFLSGEEMFGDYTLTQEEFQKLYRYILDGTFERARKRIKWYWITDVRKQLKQYSRISVGLIV